METIILVIHIVTAFVIIGIVLLQQGKGADMGASFGSGASASLFGVRGSANFLSRLTAICVAIFFMANIALTYMYSHQSNKSVVKVEQKKK